MAMAKDAKGHGSEKRGGASAVAAPAYEGKPTWHGVMPNGQKVTNQAGNKLSYASPEAAVAGAAWQHGVEGRSLAARDPLQNPQLNDKQAASALAQGGAKSAPVPVHGGATGRSDGPLAGMTQSKWSGMSQAERERVRDNSALTPQLKGLEGHRVEATTGSGETRRFIVGKSTGWAPIHLEIKKSNSFGGGPASKSYASVRSLGKVR
jgi:hypothetical protein